MVTVAVTYKLCGIPVANSRVTYRKANNRLRSRSKRPGTPQR